MCVYGARSGLIRSFHVFPRREISCLLIYNNNDHDFNEFYSGLIKWSCQILSASPHTAWKLTSFASTVPIPTSGCLEVELGSTAEFQLYWLLSYSENSHEKGRRAAPSNTSKHRDAAIFLLFSTSRRGGSAPAYPPALVQSTDTVIIFYRKTES